MPAVPAADPAAEYPANTSPAAPASAPAAVPAAAPPPPTPPAAAAPSPAITSGSKSIVPMEITVNAIAPTIAQPPGITSLTALSIAAPALPIAGPGSILDKASPAPRQSNGSVQPLPPPPPIIWILQRLPSTDSEEDLILIHQHPYCLKYQVSFLSLYLAAGYQYHKQF